MISGLLEIDNSGMLKYFKKHLKADIDALTLLKSNLVKFKDKIDKESIIKNNYKSQNIMESENRKTNFNIHICIIYTT